jgi:hypothetical protein
MRRERQAGRQAGSEGGRKGELREGGSGDQWWPAEVGSKVSCPATIVLFVPCVCACGLILLSHKLCLKFVTSTNTRVT